MKALKYLMNGVLMLSIRAEKMNLNGILLVLSLTKVSPIASISKRIRIQKHTLLFAVALEAN